MHIRISPTPEQQRLTELVAAARMLSTYPEIDWGSTRWEIRQHDRSRRAHNRDARALVFARRRVKQADPWIPFAAPYDDFAKTLLRMRASLRGVNSSSQQTMLSGLRLLYEPLSRSQQADPTGLTRAHFQMAADDARRDCAETSAYVIGQALSEIVGFLNTHRLTRVRIPFRNPFARPEPGDRLDPVSQIAGMLKMPSPMHWKR